MTPEEMAQKITDLERLVFGLLRAETIDRDIETALTTRIFNNGAVGSAGATVSNGSFPVVVPANPSGTVRVSIGNRNYDLLYK